MILGASQLQVPLITYAKELGLELTSASPGVFMMIQADNYSQLYERV